MAEILIVNPSVNMRLASMEMKMYGNSVRYVYTNDIPFSNAKRVFYFFPDANVCFTTEAQGEVKRDDRIFLFKNNIFSRIKMMNYKKDFEIYRRNTKSISYMDLVFFERGALHFEDNQEIDGKLIYNSLEDAVVYNHGSVIFTNMLLGKNIGSGENICFWETDFDILSTFSSDYFIFLSEDSRIEAYIYNNMLITLGKGTDHIKGISKTVPLLNKFNFKNVETKQVSRSLKPWTYHVSNMSAYLINDYSFGRVSISMPSAWYDKIANYLHVQINKRYKNK